MAGWLRNHSISFLDIESKTISKQNGNWDFRWAGGKRVEAKPGWKDHLRLSSLAGFQNLGVANWILPTVKESRFIYNISGYLFYCHSAIVNIDWCCSFECPSSSLLLAGGLLRSELAHARGRISYRPSFIQGALRMSYGTQCIALFAV